MQPISIHDTDREAPGLPLEAHVHELRGRCETAARLQGGATHYWEEVRIFRDYAKECGLCLDRLPAEIAGRPPEEECNEHQVWFIRDNSWVMKVTWPDCFGLLVVYRPDEDERASPIAYLERWSLHNDLFGDQVRLVGVVVEAEQLRMVIAQPAIRGEPATLEQIRDFFVQSGWKPFTVDGETAYFDPHRGVVISDTHRSNLILMGDGQLAPIDLRVQLLNGAMLDYVTKACHC